MPVQKESTSQNIVGDGKSGVSSDRLQAVARGDNVPAEVHQSVFDTTPVLKINAFSLWYGTKRSFMTSQCLFLKIRLRH